MKTVYRGFDITAEKTKDVINYSAFRQSDDFEVVSGVDYDNTKITEIVAHLKGVVDDFIKDPSAYYTENADFGDDLPPEDYDEYDNDDVELTDEEANC